MKAKRGKKTLYDFLLVLLGFLDVVMYGLMASIVFLFVLDRFQIGAVVKVFLAICVISTVCWFVAHAINDAVFWEEVTNE